MAYELSIFDHDDNYSVSYGRAHAFVRKNKYVQGKHWWSEKVQVRKSDEEIRAELTHASFEVIERHKRLVAETNHAVEIAAAVTETVNEIDRELKKL